MERYRIRDDAHVYFVTFSIVEWLPVFVTEATFPQRPSAIPLFAGCQVGAPSVLLESLPARFVAYNVDGFKGSMANKDPELISPQLFPPSALRIMRVELVVAYNVAGFR